jgi:Cysteine-rich CPCC
MTMEKSKCACCFYYTVEGMSDIYPVCYWQKDFYQEERIDDDGGPNTTSLRESREHYKKYGVIDLKLKEYVRLPLEEELQAPLSNADPSSMTIMT